MEEDRVDMVGGAFAEDNRAILKRLALRSSVGIDNAIQGRQDDCEVSKSRESSGATSCYVLVPIKQLLSSEVPIREREMPTMIPAAVS